MPRSQVWDGNQWVDMTDATSGVSEHTDLQNVTSDQHHAKYTDAEAQAANPPDLHHFIQTAAPSSPVEGDVWVNPDAEAEDIYLGLRGKRIMSGKYSTASIANSTVITQFVIENPGIVGGCVVWIEAHSTLGFAGAAVSANVVLSGTTDPSNPQVYIAAAKWGTAYSFGYWVFTDETSPAKLINVEALNDVSCYYQGLWTVTIEDNT